MKWREEALQQLRALRSFALEEKITKQCNQLNKCKSIISLWCQLKTHHLFDERVLWRFRKKEHFKERAPWCQLKFQKIIFLMMFQLKCCFSPILSWHRELSFHFCRSQLRTTGNPPVAVSVTVVTLTNTSLSKTPTEVSVIRQQLSSIVLLGSGSTIGAETPQGGESWRIHFTHHYFIVLVNGLVWSKNLSYVKCTEVYLYKFMCQPHTCVLWSHGTLYLLPE